MVDHYLSRLTVGAGFIRPISKHLCGRINPAPTKTCEKTSEHCYNCQVFRLRKKHYGGQAEPGFVSDNTRLCI